MTEPWRLNIVENPIKRSEAALIASASASMHEALAAWIEDDHGKVSVHAPHAVELLGKAALWRESPVLLLPLTNNAEASLFILAQKPDLTTSGLRTIGLATVLARLERLLGSLPLDSKQRSRMADTRNGAMHVGTHDQSRYVLTDAVTVCSLLLPRLERTASDFFGKHAEMAAGLMEKRRTEVEHRVANKRAKARNLLTMLEGNLGPTEFEDVTNKRESEAEYVLEADPSVASHGLEGDCPECRATGRLFGDVQVRHEVDYDYEQLPDGDIHPTLVSDYYLITFIPKAFACNVCKLELNGREELQAAGVDTVPMDVDEHQLDNDFDPARYLEDSQYGAYE